MQWVKTVIGFLQHEMEVIPMVFARRKANLILSEEDRSRLETISKSRTEKKQYVERSQILLMYAKGEAVLSIARETGLHRNTVNNCISKALEFGPMAALNDLPRKGRKPSISQAARAWVISLACQKPKELGYPHEMWTLLLLSEHARENCQEAGHPSLLSVRRGTICKILNKREIQPHKMNYYLEKRDEFFEEKMNQVLFVYKEVELLRENNQDQYSVAIVSYDEKPGIQALENIAPDRPPKPGKYSRLGRDYEYKRHGTVSLMGAIDLLDGHVHGMVADRHRSAEFVEFLKGLDVYYQDRDKIRVILDNHSAHISKETRKYLETVPNRFEFIFTPTHGSWLNLIECFFSKMARTFLRGIRVKSKQELKDRILEWVKFVNDRPVIFKWKYLLEKVEVG